jgi:hypothetical protein
MQMHENEMLASIERLQVELARQRRRSWACMAIAAVSLLAVLGGHATMDAQGDARAPVVRHKVLQAERFELVDDKGLLLATLKRHATTKRPTLSLHDNDGHPRAYLALTEDYHPLLGFDDDKRRQRLLVHLNDDFAGQIDMFDEKDNANIEIQAGKQPHLYMRDGSQYTTVELKSGKGGGFLTLKGDDSSMAHFGLDDKSNPKLELQDKRANTVFEAPKE